jgi:hypothetical protein
MWNVLHKLENFFIKEGSLFLLFATLRFPKPKSPPTHSMLLVWLESYEWVVVCAFVKFIPMVQGYWTILSKKIQQDKKNVFRKIQARKLIENAWLMYFTVCEDNIKWWNKSTVDWTLEIIVPHGQIWLNLLMHDCHCGYIFFQEKGRTAFFVRE